MKYRVIALLFILFSITLISFIPVTPDTLLPKTSKHQNQDKEKKKEKLSKESDWLYYAETAKERIQQNQNLQDALELIDHSLDLQVNAINLEIKGDYYTRIGDLSNAFKQYQKAIQICIFDIYQKRKLSKLQEKALKIRTLLSIKK